MASCNEMESLKLQECNNQLKSAITETYKDKLSNLGTFCERNGNSSTISDLFHGVYTRDIWTWTEMARRFRGRSHKNIIARPLASCISYNLFRSLSYMCRYTKYTPFRCVVTGSCICAAKRRTEQKVKLYRWLCPFLYLLNTGSHSPTHELSLTVLVPLSTFQCARGPCTRTLLHRLESLNSLKQGM